MYYVLATSNLDMSHALLCSWCFPLKYPVYLLFHYEVASVCVNFAGGID